MANLTLDEYIEEFVVRYGSKEEVVKKSFNANNITPTSFKDGFLDPREENIVALYIEYLEALAHANEAIDFFKYTDGEESVDKSKVYDQRRRVAQDLYIAWRNAKLDLRRDNFNTGSFFKMRKRASWLDARTR